ncbi:MAG TPA: HAD family phosphatase [Caproiciproducens sp.]|jgi:haloacid dehalogenase superfamily, subfamily IA, variant 3 with third motif having DD or ED|nr:HAD family phosphatase [Caproiciproducens sp.]
MIEAVVFDMDGILFDTERLWGEAWKHASTKLGCTDASVLKPKAMGMNWTQLKQFFYESLGPDFPYEEYMKLAMEDMAENIEKNGLPVKPGLYELLDYLKRNGYKIAVATSTERMRAMKYFGKAGIKDYFDGILCGDMVEIGKPDPDIYLKAAALIQIEPQKCMALEDSPNGLISANRAGMKTVMVPDTVEPTAELTKLLFACVPSLKEVIPLLEQEKSNGSAD